jgi:hypothetical protein
MTTDVALWGLGISLGLVVTLGLTILRWVQGEVGRLRDRVDALEQQLMRVAGAEDLANEIVRAWDDRRLGRKRVP